MKVYTHPNIVMPAGTVVVKFYDFSDTGAVTLPNCIKEIGDVEEGFEINFGDYYTPECSFVLHNDSTNTIYDMLINNDLFVSVIVDGTDLYFFGYVDKQSIEPSENFKNEIIFDGVGALATLSNYKIADFETDILSINDGPVGYNRVRAYLRFMAQHCHLKSFLISDIEYILARKYSYYSSPTYYPYYLYDVLLSDAQWTSGVIANRYEVAFANAFEMLNAIKNDFFFHPSIIWDGTDFKLKIIEKDYYGSNNSVTLPDIITEGEDLSFANKRLLVDAKDRDDTIAETNIRFEAEDATMYDSSEVEAMHIHTNVAAAAVLNVFLYVNNGENVARVSNFTGSSYVDYSSFHEALFEAIKTNHFNYKKGLNLTLCGLKATISGSSKIEYLSPGYRFIKDSVDHYIHSVTRSLSRNETDVRCLVLE